MDFKTFEEKALHDMEQLENKNAELAEKLEVEKANVDFYKDREAKYKELIYLFGAKYRDCTTMDGKAIDFETIYPVDKEVYERVQTLLKELGVILKNA